MKILHVIDSLDFTRGGPPQVCANLITEQAKNHKISLLTYSNENTNRKSIANADFENHSVGNTGVLEHLFGIHSRLKLEQIAKDFDVVHLHGVWESILCSSANFANRHSLPYIVTLHGMLDEWPMRQKTLKKHAAFMLGRRKLISGAKAIHSLSANEAKQIRKQGFHNRYQIIPNGIALDSITPGLQRETFFSAYPHLAHKPFVLFLGRLHYVKGLDILSEASAIFFKQFPHWNLVVAGNDAGMQNSLERVNRSLGIESKVHLIGPVYDALKYSLLASCQIFCAPSRQEAFSVSIIEAMAASKPVAISTKCYFDEVETSNAGLIFELDPLILSRSLCKLAGSEKLRNEMGRNGRQLVEQHYNWPTVNKEIMDCYASC